MSSTLIKLPVNTWVKLSDAGNVGSILHKDGVTTVVYTQSTNAPATFDKNTPVMIRTNRGEMFPYFGIQAGVFIYANAISEEAEITLTPAGQ